MASERAADQPIPVAWIGLEETDTVYANVFVVQNTPAGEFVLTFGELVQPILAGDAAQRDEQLQRLPFVPIRTVSRVALNEQRVKELSELLSRIVEQYRSQRGGAK